MLCMALDSGFVTASPPLSPSPLPPLFYWKTRVCRQRFNNCLQLLSCICNIAAICVEEIRELARIIDLIADLVYMSTVGCMTVSFFFCRDHGLDCTNQVSSVTINQSINHSITTVQHWVTLEKSPMSPRYHWAWRPARE